MIEILMNRLDLEGLNQLYLAPRFRTIMKWLPSLGSALLIFLGCAAPTQAQSIIYAATGSNGIAGSVYTIDATTGATLTTSVLHVGTSGGALIGLTGMAFDPTNGLLYGVTANRVTAGGNTLSAHLVSITFSSGVAIATD